MNDFEWVSDLLSHDRADVESHVSSDFAVVMRRTLANLFCAASLSSQLASAPYSLRTIFTAPCRVLLS